jgi:threonine/homoserine/homoserine lactone efflux protein
LLLLLRHSQICYESLTSPSRIASFYDGCNRAAGNSGPAVLYIVARSVDQGRKAGLASSSGVATGGLIHVLAAALGLSALLASSATAYSFVKYAGAAYLIYLGIRKLREPSHTADEVKHVEPSSLRHIYVQGIVVQALNPKTAIFFFAFLPQFVDPALGSVTLQFLALGDALQRDGLH